MEPLPKERSDGPSSNAMGPLAASMEPLPKERSDGERDRTRATAEVASMEPLPKERSDAAASPRNPLRDARASMEPLPKERSDVRYPDRDSQCQMASLNGAAPEGAERRGNCRNHRR